MKDNKKNRKILAYVLFAIGFLIMIIWGSGLVPRIIGMAFIILYFLVSPESPDILGKNKK
ncbi:hypothetical protein [Aerococcus urinaeequi]|uniref:hypothetical protein n=1 Tax=Aerococcus urinaeequi TaxID=51665 RepID=UPI003D6A0CE7